MDYRLALMCGTDIPVPECQLIIHQPSLYEISMLGETKYFIGAQCLTLYKTMFIQDKNLLSQINNFQIFMKIMQEKEAQDKKQAVEDVLTLLFPQQQVLFTPNSLLFRQKDGEGENVIIDINNFEILQEVLRQVFCVTNGPMDQQTFNPSGKKAQEIAQKLQRGRERIAAEQGEKNASILSQYLSVLSVGLYQSLNDLKKLTIYQLYDLIERYHLWISWDLDIRTRLAGGKIESKPDNWMKNIHN